MVDKDKKPSKKKKPSEPIPPDEPDQLSEPDQEMHRETVTQGVAVRKDQQRTRPEEVRLDMMRSIITEPLLSQVQKEFEQGNTDARFDVIVALNELFDDGISGAMTLVRQRAEKWGVRYGTVSQYCFASLTVRQILALAEEARGLFQKHGRSGSAIYRIWEDTDVDVALTKSLTTVKADAAQRAFQAHGAGIVWAVLDSGIQGDHPHFEGKRTPFGTLDSLNIPRPLAHMDFTPDGRRNTGDGETDDGETDQEQTSSLTDRFGHGTHVAGIIAGFWESSDPDGELVVGTEMRNEQTNDPIRQRDRLRIISGVAPACKLVSMKVIADITLAGETRQTAGQGKVSWVLMAIEQIQQWNQYGKRLLVHGANLSLGYDFDPRWFACGQSPICVEVNRLVKSGVCVVVSAGNSGYSSFVTASGRSEARFNDLTITDPGNAEFAITVGSTHKEAPHTYGVSYFSSRGPTGDGRQKPDMLAPGERIISCAAGAEAKKCSSLKEDGKEVPALFCEQSGTSMAAPHVSGAIAAFLSVRPEFVGQAERVKEIFMANCIDLRRERSFQGAGLLDLMKVLQAVQVTTPD